MGLLGLPLLAFVFSSFYIEAEAMTWASALCDSYKNTSSTYVSHYYDAGSDSCAFFVRWPQVEFQNIVGMCNQLAVPINGTCQVVNTFNHELGLYLNNSLFAPQDLFFLGLVREPNCGPWEWLRYDGSSIPQPTGLNDTNCAQNNSIYQVGQTIPSSPSIYPNTTGFLCQCYRPMRAATQAPPMTTLGSTIFPSLPTISPIGNLTGNGSGNGNCTLIGYSVMMMNGTAGNSTDCDDYDGDITGGNSTNVTQASPTAATTPRSVGSIGPQWIILIGTFLFALLHPTRQLNLLKL
ncbi:unnamed protein product, partial [Mesorhabditis belari]|uniref:Uncharacterized protein n=1 Tax=Mesorhabditis belari TaxID=2138241 RepID=A0AAF3FLL8_9BILA